MRGTAVLRLIVMKVMEVQQMIICVCNIEYIAEPQPPLHPPPVTPSAALARALIIIVPAIRT
jgi:hypothetical protein